MSAFLERFRFQTRAQGIRDANRALTHLEGLQERDVRESLEQALATSPPHFGPEYLEGFHATMRDALGIVEAHARRRELAEKQAEEARQRAEEARQNARQRVTRDRERILKRREAAQRELEAAEQAMRDTEQALADAERAGARHDAYAEQREADAARPVPRLYDARFK